jgi:hypothetical protein
MIRNILFRNDAKTALKTRVLWQKSKTEVFKTQAESGQRGMRTGATGRRRTLQAVGKN